jgi:hypothetical protein
MSDSTDMSTPVTRGEFAQFEVRLEQRLAQLATKAELAQLATKAELEQRLVPLATKVELELWGGASLARVLARIELWERRLIERLDSREQRLIAELARQRAISKSQWTQIAVTDEKYADLPPRVTRLKTKVFRPRRR